MRITSIEITNFRSIRHAVIDLATSNILIGHSQQGKSSVQNALQMALCGWCEHTDRRGAGYQCLIGDHGPESVVVVHTDTVTVRLTLGSKRTWQCVDFTTGEIVTDLWEHVGIDRTAATLCMFPMLASMDDALTEYLSGMVDVGTLPVTDYAAGLADQRGMTMDSMESFRVLGMAAYDKRRDMNRDLKQAEATIAAIGYVKPQTAGDQSEKIKALYKQLGLAEAARPVRPRAELETECARLTSEIQALEAFQNAEKSATRAVDAALQAQHRLQQAENSAPNECPTCGKKMTAKERAAFVASAVAEALQVSERAHQEQERTAAVERDCEELLLEWNITATAAEISDALTRVRADMAVQPYDGPRGGDIQLQIAALETVQRNVTAYQELTELQARADYLRREIAELQTIVEQYYEGRVIKSRIAELAAPLLARVNECCEAGPVTLEAEGKRLAVYCNGRPLRLESNGGKAAVAYAMALAFADCGAPVLFDDVNNLDPRLRKRYINRLRRRAEGTVVMASTPLTEEIPLDVMATALAPMAVIHVEDGNCNVVA